MEQLEPVGSTLDKLLVQSPTAAAVIIVVALFLAALWKIMQLFKDMLQVKDGTIKRIVDDYMKASREQREETGKLREIIGANSEIINRCISKLNQLTPR